MIDYDAEFTNTDGVMTLIGMLSGNVLVGMSGGLRGVGLSGLSWYHHVLLSISLICLLWVINPLALVLRHIRRRNEKTNSGS